MRSKAVNVVVLSLAALTLFAAVFTGVFYWKLQAAKNRSAELAANAPQEAGASEPDSAAGMADKQTSADPGKTQGGGTSGSSGAGSAKDAGNTGTAAVPQPGAQGGDSGTQPAAGDSGSNAAAKEQAASGSQASGGNPSSSMEEDDSSSASTEQPAAAESGSGKPAPSSASGDATVKSYETKLAQVRSTCKQQAGKLMSGAVKEMAAAMSDSQSSGASAAQQKVLKQAAAAESQCDAAFQSVVKQARSDSVSDSVIAGWIKQYQQEKGSMKGQAAVMLQQWMGK